MKTIALTYILLLILVFSILPAMACTPEEEPIEIATCSLNQVIEAAIVRSPECRLQVPGVNTKG
jgi:hypothetical protein